MATPLDYQLTDADKARIAALSDSAIQQGFSALHHGLHMWHFTDAFIPEAWARLAEFDAQLLARPTLAKLRARLILDSAQEYITRGTPDVLDAEYDARVLLADAWYQMRAR